LLGAYLSFTGTLSSIPGSHPRFVCSLRLFPKKRPSKPVLGLFLKRKPFRLLKVKSRGHVYPLSYFPYF